MKVGELEEANAALEDMNTQMEASALQAQSQKDELQAQITSLLSNQEQAAGLEKQKQDLKLQLQVQPIFLLCHFLSSAKGLHASTLPQTYQVAR